MAWVKIMILHFENTIEGLKFHLEGLREEGMEIPPKRSKWDIDFGFNLYVIC